MRAWRAICIAGAVLALGVVLVLAFVKPSRVYAEALGETNGYRTVLIRNDAAQPYYVTAWGEFYANDAWERLSLSNAFLKVEAERYIHFPVLMPTNCPRRIVLVYRPIKAGIGAWINKLKARLRMNPHVEREYIEIE